MTDKLTLMRLHVVAIVVHLFSFSCGVYFIRDGNPVVDIIAPLFEFTVERLFLPNPKIIFSIGLLTPIVCVECITAFFHMIYFWALYDPRVDTYIKSFLASPSANPLRWVEYGITATLMSSFGSVAIGITDFYFFIRNITCGIILQGLGYLIEILSPYKDSELFPAKKLYRNLFYFQGLLNNLPMIAILLYQTFASNTGSSQKIFIENVFPLAIWFNTFGVICQLSFYKWRQFSDPLFTEKWYIILSISTKIAIFWAEFATFKKIQENNGLDTVGIDWDGVRYCALTIPFAVVFFTALYDLQKWQKNNASSLLKNLFFYK